MARYKNRPRGFKSFEKTYLERLVANNEECSHCDGLAETLHHKDEDRKNHRKYNLLPLCHKCHDEIPHLSDLKGG